MKAKKAGNDYEDRSRTMLSDTVTTAGRKIVTWQPALVDIQAYTYQAIAQATGQSVVAYVESMRDMTRTALGAPATRVSTLEQRLIPKRGFLRYCYCHLREQQQDIHLFYSPFQDWRLMACLVLAAWMGVEFYLISEPYSPKPEGYYSDDHRWFGEFKALLRPWLYKVYAIILRHRLAGVFAISDLALAQYEAAGISPSKLFEFGYFIPLVSDLTRVSSRPNEVARRDLRIIFVGSLIRRKGLDLLQAAVALLHGQGYTVSVHAYGPGDSSQFANECPSLCYRGTIPFGDAQSVIGQYDLLILPSRHDGWGVVVNEALCAGVPVVCSDTVGAGSVAVRLGAGLSFESENVISICNVLGRLASNPALLQSLRDATSRAARLLQPEVAAAYMVEVLRSPPADRASLPPPWSQKCHNSPLNVSHQ